MIGSICFIMLLLFLLLKDSTTQVSYMEENFFLKEETFEIGWIHSVEKEQWFETYKRKNGSLYLVETRFKTFGAGTPSTGEIIRSNDGFVHMKMDMKMDELRLAVSENVQTTLYTKTSTVPLYELVKDYETVIFEVKKIPLWLKIRGEHK